MDIETAKATLLSAVYDNKPFHRHMLLALLSCPTLKAIKEAMLDIKSLYPGETKSNNKTPAGLPQSKETKNPKILVTSSTSQ